MKETVGDTDFVKFQRAADLDNLEFLHATFVKHSFPRHTHDTFAIGVIEKGVQQHTTKAPPISPPVAIYASSTPARSIRDSPRQQRVGHTGSSSPVPASSGGPRHRSCLAPVDFPIFLPPSSGTRPLPWTYFPFSGHSSTRIFPSKGNPACYPSWHT